MGHWSVVVAQLVGPLLPTPEVCGSNPIDALNLYIRNSLSNWPQNIGSGRSFKMERRVKQKLKAMIIPFGQFRL